MVWMGAIMSAAGFTWCYLILEAFGAYQFQLLDQYWLGITLEAGYVVLVPVILFAGYAITLDSWARAFRNGGVLNYGAAAYNTWATYHNTYNAINSFGKAFGDVVDSFTGKGRGRSSDSKDSGNAAMALLVLLLLALSLILGIGTTAMIIRRNAAHGPLPSLDELKRKQAA
jgi:hypothetical protein